MKKWISYILYGILITIVFLYYLFPSEIVRNYIVSTLTNNNPGIHLSIGAVNIGFPLAIRCENLVVSFKDKRGSALKANIVKVRPAFMDLLASRFSLLVNADVYGGNVDANISFKNRMSTEGPMEVIIGLDNINVGECSYLRNVSNRQIDGRLRGFLKFNGEYEKIINSTGNAEFILVDSSIKLLKNMFGLDILNFDRIEISMRLKNRILKMNEINFAGEQVNGTLKGNIFLQRNVTQSRLALKGNIEIPALNRQFSTFLTGTLANPIPRFM
jgi:type II secretion system protein N